MARQVGFAAGGSLRGPHAASALAASRFCLRRDVDRLSALSVAREELAWRPPVVGGALDPMDARAASRLGMKGSSLPYVRYFHPLDGSTIKMACPGVRSTSASAEIRSFHAMHVTNIARRALHWDARRA